MSKNFLCAIAIGLALLSGCASVPMAPKERDAELKTFKAPPQDQAALYIYRNSMVGQALKKGVSIDGKMIGETANNVYFYQLLSPGTHTLATESEFSDNAISLNAKGGETYFARQAIKMGAFVGGAKLEMVTAAVGRKEVLRSQLAISTPVSGTPAPAAAPVPAVAAPTAAPVAKPLAAERASAQPVAATPARAPAAAVASSKSRAQQLDELAKIPGLSYEEYQRRYRLITQ
ncbi:MAG: DUF2846 domain-containing protein [Pseudomonas sp.]|uniref:DUF2846 domain-containing protein n=1 Tax=Pseudomonas sp. TaxID=306 RepID=UPI0033977B6F